MTSLPKSLQRIARACALVLVVSALGACGFHLRNALAIPPDLGPLRVVSPYQYSPLATALSEALDRAGAVPAAPGATTGVATLRILSERWGNTALSVDQRGRAQEFTLRYAVVFRMTRADQSEVVHDQVIELSRDYISVATNSSGTEGEREVLTKELQRSMVASILLRIDAAFRNPTAFAAPTGAPDSSGSAPSVDAEPAAATP